MTDPIADLARALVTQEHAEERLTKAAHALAEAEDDPDAAAEVAGAGSSTKPRMRL